MKTKFILLIFIFSFTAIFNAKDAQPSIEQGQTWYLESRSNKLTPSNSKVLYFFSNDAYNVLQARLFSDWDRFSIIDSKNLVRLNTGDSVEILKSKQFEKIYEVNLIEGFEKN